MNDPFNEFLSSFLLSIVMSLVVSLVVMEIKQWSQQLRGCGGALRLLSLTLALFLLAFLLHTLRIPA